MDFCIRRREFMAALGGAAVWPLAAHAQQGEGIPPSSPVPEARPGGDMTGFGLKEPSMGGKWLQLLKEFAPGVAHIAVIFNPETAPYARLFVPSINATGHSLSVEPVVSPVRTESELEQAIATVGRDQRGGLIVLPDPFTTDHRELIIALAARHRVPAIYALRSFAAAGGLIAYGTRVADLPIQMPTKFELAINIKTAKALGLVISPTLLGRTTEVIE
jgi:putative ABC transport system substrate-binding protein